MSQFLKKIQMSAVRFIFSHMLAFWLNKLTKKMRKMYLIVLMYFKGFLMKGGPKCIRVLNVYIVPLTWRMMSFFQVVLSWIKKGKYIRVHISKCMKNETEYCTFFISIYWGRILHYLWMTIFVSKKGAPSSSIFTDAT